MPKPIRSIKTLRKMTNKDGRFMNSRFTLHRGATNARILRFGARPSSRLLLKGIPILTKILRREFCARNNAFQGSNRNRLAAMIRDDHLASVGVTPFLMTASLRNAIEAMSSKHTCNIPSRADWEALAHGL